MTNRPKRIGTATESAIVTAARERGFPMAERLALHGTLDEADIALCPGVVIESKGGHAAELASDALIEKWLDETATEKANRGAAVAFLVRKRKGVGNANAHRWWAHWQAREFLSILGIFGIPELPRPNATVTTTLDDSLVILRAAGYGEALEAAS